MLDKKFKILTMNRVYKKFWFKFCMIMGNITFKCLKENDAVFYLESLFIILITCEK